MKAARSKERVTWIIISILVLIYALFPVASIMATSFKLPSELTSGKFLPTTWSGSNYEQILVGSAQDLFLSSLRNSIGIALIATFIAVVLATLCAYAIARLDFPGKKAHPHHRPGGVHLPGDLDRHAAVQPLAEHRPVRHLAGPDHSRTCR